MPRCRPLSARIWEAPAFLNAAVVSRSSWSRFPVSSARSSAPVRGWGNLSCGIASAGVPPAFVGVSGESKFVGVQTRVARSSRGVPADAKEPPFRELHENAPRQRKSRATRAAFRRRLTAMPAMQAAAAARHSAPAAGPAPRAAAAATPPTKGSDAITMSKSSFTPPIIKNLKLFEGVKRHIKVKIIFFVGPNILISEKRD